MKQMDNMQAHKHANVQPSNAAHFLSCLFMQRICIKPIASLSILALVVGLLLVSVPSYSQYSGGSYDGFAVSSTSCTPALTLADIYTGGSYDGFAASAKSCV